MPKVIGNHPICDGCFEKKKPGAQPTRSSVAVRRWERCCFCGRRHRSGVFMRETKTAAPHCTCE